MADLNSYMNLTEPVTCTRKDYEILVAELKEESRRQEEEELVCHCIKCDYTANGLLYISSDSFGEDDLSHGVCCAIGRLATTVNRPFLEFGYSQWSSDEDAEGGVFRIYADGRLVWPRLVWE